MASTISVILSVLALLASSLAWIETRRQANATADLRNNDNERRERERIREREEDERKTLQELEEREALAKERRANLRAYAEPGLNGSYKIKVKNSGPQTARSVWVAFAGDVDGLGAPDELRTPVTFGDIARGGISDITIAESTNSQNYHVRVVWKDLEGGRSITEDIVV